jgi:hypothetical protein
MRDKKRRNCLKGEKGINADLDAPTNNADKSLHGARA